MDNISDYLFAPTNKQASILKGEGFSNDKIFVVGNTIVDAVQQNLEISENKSNILESLKIIEGKYFLATAHRKENVDDNSRLNEIIKSLKVISKEYNTPVIYPIHPRTSKKLKEFNINIGSIRLIKPVGYLDFLQLLQGSRLVLTDSGGVQEETCIMQVPCVTLRDNTERPETIEVGSNSLGGASAESISEAVSKMINKSTKWHHPYGDGNSGKKIVEILNQAISQ